MTRKNFNSLNNILYHSFIPLLFRTTVVIFIILALFLFLPWQQTVKGEGELIAQNPSERVHTISATVDGFIENLYIRENQYIKKGDPLFKMTDLDLNYENRIKSIDSNIETQIRLTQNEISILNQNKTSLNSQLKNGVDIYSNKIKQAKEQFNSLLLSKSLLDQNLNVEFLNFERMKELYKESIESKRTLERAENAYIKAKTEFDNNAIILNVQKRQIEILEKEKTQFILDSSNSIRSVDNSMNSSSVRINGLSREEHRQSSDISRYAASDVKSQKDGHILKVLVNDKNQYLSKGDPVIEFSPVVTKRVLVLKISNFHMPLIKKGLLVRVMFYGWPSFHISGWPTIKHGTFSGIVDRVDPVSSDGEFHYAYIVEDPSEPWPDSDVLKVGSKASVWVRLSVVPIWSEIWRLMNAAPPKITKVTGK